MERGGYGDCKEEGSGWRGLSGACGMLLRHEVCSYARASDGRQAAQGFGAWRWPVRRHAHASEGERSPRRALRDEIKLIWLVK